MREEAFLDIAWRQFQKNRFALASLWILALLILLALFAPLLASNQPLTYRTGGETIHPWFRALFNTEETVDFIFNMGLVAFFPSLALVLLRNPAWKKRGIPGRRRTGFAVTFFLGLVTLLSLLCGPLGIRPQNLYWARTFPLEEFESKGAAQAHYVLIPFGPIEQDIDVRYQPPLHRKPAELCKESNDGYTHWLGTDDIGRDILTRMLYGTRLALTVGIVAVALYATIGVIVGSLAGYFGGRVDLVISRLVEVVQLFPAFFLILILVAMIGPSIYVIMVSIGITGWTSIARLTRGEVLKQRSLEYATAARAMGASHMRVLFRHILPNALSPTFVAVPFGIASAVVTEGGLSLLGYGVRPPAPSWGTLLNLAHGNYQNWWLVVVPSVAIFITVTVFNLVGNALRDAMDPRMRM